MPRKERTATGTRAERWWRDYEARRRSIAPGVVEVRAAPEAVALALLLSPSHTDLDAPIRNAIAKGFLSGNVRDHRRDLVVTAAMAWGAVATSHAHAVAAPVRKERRERASRLADELRSLCRELGSEASGIEEGGEAAGTVEDASPERAVAAAGAMAAAALEAFTAREAPTAGLTEESALRAEVDAWWRESAVDPDRRGGAVVRNEIIEALLRTMKHGAARD